MKKLLLSIACLTALSSSVSAESIGFFGVELGYTSMQGVSAVDLNNQSSDVSYGVRLGALNDEWRTMFVGNYVDSGEQSIQTGLVSADYFVAGYQANGFSPYIGAHAGYGAYEADYVNGKGFLYGGQGGVIIDVMDNLNIDVSYRFTLGQEEELDNAQSFIIAFDYKL